MTDRTTFPYIFAIDKDEAYLEALHDAVEDVCNQYSLQTFTETDQALKCISNSLRDTEARLPDLVFAGLDSPQKYWSFLREIKTHPALETIPIVAFTPWKDDGLIRSVYRYHANICIRRPASISRAFKDKLSKIVYFCVHMLALPDCDVEPCPSLSVNHQQLNIFEQRNMLDALSG